MKADHHSFFIFLVYMNVKIQSKPVRHSQSSSFLSKCGWIIHHSPGVNRNIRGTRLILKPCLEHLVLCVCLRWKLNHKGTDRRSETVASVSGTSDVSHSPTSTAGSFVFWSRSMCSEASRHHCYGLCVWQKTYRALAAAARRRYNLVCGKHV